nr:GNAT family N-acetyltransferase [Sphingomicrobium sediminis]
MGEGDVSVGSSINALYAAAFEDDEHYLSAPPSGDYLRTCLSDPLFLAFVAEDEGKVVGALTGYELRKFEREASELYIYDLAVDEDYRREGVASALIEAVRSHGREIGATVVFVQADKDDAPPMALYAKFGKRGDHHHFDIEP